MAGGAAYAAGQPEGQTADETLTTEDIIGGAEAGSEYKEAETQETQETHTATHTTTEHVVIVENRRQKCIMRRHRRQKSRT